MNTDLPAPPVPPTIDLRGLPYMPLDVVRLRDSELAVMTRGDEFRCAVLLWCACWHQVPAASLPDDDLVLAQLAGFGRVVREWRKVKAGALRGFVKCSDGRLYHEVVAEKALDAWRGRLEQRWRTECARLKKNAQRSGKVVDLPDLNSWILRECPESIPYLSPARGDDVPGDAPGTSQGHPHSVPRETASKRSEVKGSSSNHTGVEGCSIGEALDETPGGGDPPPKPAFLARIAAECARVKISGLDQATIERWAKSGATPALVGKAISDASSSWARTNSIGDLPIGYVSTTLERILKAEAEARTLLEARDRRTQETIAEGKAAEARKTPPPEGLVSRYTRKASI